MRHFAHPASQVTCAVAHPAYHAKQLHSFVEDEDAGEFKEIYYPRDPRGELLTTIVARAAFERAGKELRDAVRKAIDG